MVKILLICGGGASSGFLVNAMIKAAKKQGIEVDIKARSETQLSSLVMNSDVILGAPHMRAQEAKFKEICGHHHKPYAFVDPMDYATMEGEKVLNFALEILNANK
jgi:PTS system cellobiose-specific IIB component